MPIDAEFGAERTHCCQRAGVAASPNALMAGTEGVPRGVVGQRLAHALQEMTQQFAAQAGVDVTATVKIEARSTQGFDGGLQRAVSKKEQVYNL